MKSRYILSPEAALDLIEIWRYTKREGGMDAAERVESVIREKIVALARSPGIGHWRRDLTDDPVMFFAIYSYLVVYRPDTKPLQVVAILHGRRDLEGLLRNRL